MGRRRRPRAAVVANGVWHSGGTGAEGQAIADLPASIGFGAMIWCLSHRPGPVLGSAPLRALGTLSYGVYLWHMPVLYGCNSTSASRSASLPALVWVRRRSRSRRAIASWYLVERPALASARERCRPDAGAPRGDLGGIDRDLGDADHEALGERVDAERLVEQLGGLGLELDRRALEHGGAVVVGLQRLQRAAVEEEQRRALGGDRAVDA